MEREPAPINRGFKVGDKVVKNPARWLPSEFDSWGAGEGIGEIVESPFGEIDGEVDVRWPAGRVTQRPEELLPYPDRGPICDICGKPATSGARDRIQLAPRASENSYHFRRGELRLGCDEHPATMNTLYIEG